MLTDDLLELQRIDTATDQLRHRHRTLTERGTAAAAHDELAAAERRRAELGARVDTLEAAIGSAERDGATLTTQRTRLEGQLRTVIAPREAEALMHEIETIRLRRDALDDRELEHLEEQGNVESELEQLAAGEPSLRTSVGAADAELAAGEAAIAVEQDALAAARAAIVEHIEPEWLNRYEQLRERFGGVAIARLVGTRCDGCHLDLSAAELEDVRHAPPETPTQCPQCGRFLVA